MTTSNEESETIIGFVNNESNNFIKQDSLEVVIPGIRVPPNGDGDRPSESKSITAALREASQQWCTFETRAECSVFLPPSALLNHPLYSIDRQKYCGKLRGSVRQDWNTLDHADDQKKTWEELKPSWLEVFFDLLFVAAIVHISNEVSYAFQVADFLFIATTFPQFGLLVLSWLEQVLYRSRFRMTQSIDSFLHFLYMAFVLLMGLGIGTEQQLVLIMYSLTRCVMLLMLAKTSLIPRARAHSLYMMAEPVMTITLSILLEIFVNSRNWDSRSIDYVHGYDHNHEPLDLDQ